MVKKIQLKNGLTVLFVESHKSPVVSVQMWVRTGSADETSRLRGISHFIEHLVFKGSEKFAVGEIAATVEGAGGELNAYTSFDQTVFYVTISKQYLNVALEVIDEMMARPAFIAEEIDKEREVVIEEIKRSLDSSHRQASRLLFETMYRRHPYGEPVIGFEEIIRKVSRKDLVDYFSKRYVPRNMTLLLVGDFDTQQLRPQIEGRFGQMKGGRVASAKRTREPSRRQPQVAVRGSSFKENFLFLSWPTPKATHRDIVALEVLAMILGQGDSSRLNHALRLDKTLANYAGSSIFAAQDPGFFTISASLPQGSCAEALMAIAAEWQKITCEEPSQSELDKALVNLHSEQFYTLETVDGMARKYGHFEHLYRDHKEFDRFLKMARALKPKDLVRVARKYLAPQKMTVCSLTPEAQVEANKKEIKSWTKSLKLKTVKSAKRPLLKAKAKPAALPKEWFPKPVVALDKKSNQLQKVVLNNGATVLLRPNYDTPVVSVRLAMRGGSRLDPENLLGRSELLGRSWVTATEAHDEKTLMAAIESLAANLSAFSGRNTLGLSASGLRPFAEPLLELFSEVFSRPRWSEEIIHRERTLMLEQLRTRQDNPAQLALLGFGREMFRGHPYSKDPMGQSESLKHIHGGELQAYLGLLRTAGNVTLVATGHFDPEEMVRWTEQLTNHLPKGPRREDIVAWEKPKSARRQFQLSSKEQVHIAVGFPGLTLKDSERFALQVLEAVLSGQGGRLFVELRDKNSLAYSVAPIRMEGVDAGYFGAYIGCSPEKGPKALTMLREQFKKVAEARISSEELVRAQKYLIGRHDIDLQRGSSLGAALLFEEVYGIDPGETFKYPSRIQSVGLEEVREIASRLFAQAEVVSAVGPREPWIDAELTQEKSSPILEA